MNKRNIGFTGVAFLAVTVFVFCLAPTGKTGMLSGRLTKVFTSVTVPTVGTTVYGGTQTVGSSDRFGVAYHIDEGTSTGHIQFRFAISFDDPLKTDAKDVSNWINGEYDIVSDFTADDTWAYSQLGSTQTAAPWIRFLANGVGVNATDTTVDLDFFKQ